MLYICTAPKTAEELAEIRENKKRKRKNKARAAALSHWVYIVGLPSDVTADEIKAHFSKVRNLECVEITEH